MVVEFLTFVVDPEHREQWLCADAQHWTLFLEEQPGFISKQVWLDRDQPDLVHTVITWADEASWKSIPLDALARCDEGMGEWCRPASLRTFDLANSSVV